MAVEALTPQLIAQLPLPQDGKKTQTCDSQVRGLLIERTATSASWYYRCKSAETKKTTYKRLGAVAGLSIDSSSALTLQAARKLALATKAEIAAGRDYGAERKAKQAELTLSGLFHDHYWKYVQDRKKSSLRDWQLFGRIEPKFGEKKLSAILRRDLEVFLSSLLAEGLAPATCNHHIRLIRHMLNLAIEWEMLERNVASKLKLLPERNVVNNFMDQPTLQKFLAAVQAHENPMCRAIIYFLLSTAGRVQEALKAKWSHIDLANKTWFIPAEDAKSGKARSTPLSQTALSALAQAKALVGTKDFEYVFVDTSTGDRRKTISKAFDKIRCAAGITLRPHDLRHQAISMLCANGASANLAMTLAGHASIHTTQRYMHTAGDEILRFVNFNASQIESAMKATADAAEA